MGEFAGPAAGYLRETWESPRGFLFIIIGSAVGLGTFWRFPYLAGQYGGAAFIMVYVMFVVLISLPMALAEFAIGRRGGESAVASIPRMAVEQGGSTRWRYFPWLTIFTNVVGMGFYTVIASWCVAYLYMTASGQFSGPAIPDAQAIFDRFKGNPLTLLFWHGLFTLAAVTIVARGVRKGLERAVSYIMPLMAVLLIVLVICALFIGDAGRAASFMFSPDFSRLDGKAVLVALGHAFFTIGVGGVGMATFAAYLPRQVSLPGYVATMGGVSVGAALLAGMAIFPVVFAYGLQPAAGEGLVFVTLPIVFNQVPGGYFLGVLFFLLLTCAALTPSISALEPLIDWAQERRGWKRSSATFAAGLLTWVLGILSALSFNVLAHVYPLDFIPLFKGKTIFGVFEYMIANVTLPIGVLLWSLYAGWLMPDRVMQQCLMIGKGGLYRLWRVLVRLVVPAAVIALTAYNIAG